MKNFYILSIFSFLLFSSALFSVEPKYCLAWEYPEYPNLAITYADTSNIPDSIADKDEIKMLENIAKDIVPDGARWLILKRSELPDWKWYKAWRISGNQVVVDIEIARKMHMAKIRLLRNCMLEDLDREMMRCLETDDEKWKKSIISQKKILRDLPEKIDLSIFNDVDELDSYIPMEVLPVYEEYKKYVDKWSDPEGYLNAWNRFKYRIDLWD